MSSRYKEVGGYLWIFGPTSVHKQPNLSLRGGFALGSIVAKLGFGDHHHGSKLYP